MKIELPLETWTELFGFLLRCQLVLLVPHIRKKNNKRPGRKCQPTIGNRKFVSIVQFYLHKCGQITLDAMSINPPKKRNGIPVLHYHQANREIALPADLPMPENITDFKTIFLNHVDESVLDFLKEFQGNCLLSNVNLFFNCTFDETHVSQGMLAKIFHLFTSINSIEYHCKTLEILQNRESKQTLLTLTARGLCTSYYNTDLSDDWYCNWLYSPREDGKPRVLKLHFDHGRTIPFIEHVKQDFIKANQAISFFIRIFILPNGQNVHTDQRLVDVKEKVKVKQIRDLDLDVKSSLPISDTDTLDNCKTRERLVIKGYPNEYPMPVVKILRHPIEATAESIEEMGQEWDWQNRKIIIVI